MSCGPDTGWGEGRSLSETTMASSVIAHARAYGARERWARWVGKKHPPCRAHAVAACGHATTDTWWRLRKADCSSALDQGCFTICACNWLVCAAPGRFAASHSLPFLRFFCVTAHTSNNARRSDARPTNTHLPCGFLSLPRPLLALLALLRAAGAARADLALFCGRNHRRRGGQRVR